jgi:hypothetical protein
MSEHRKKRNTDMVNELSTGDWIEETTSDQRSGKKRDGIIEENYSGDRFIPHRGSAISRQLFNMPETLLASPSDVSNKNEKEQNSLIFENILEQQLLNLPPEIVTQTLQETAEGRTPPPTQLQAGKNIKFQTTPIKKMHEQPLIIKRPKLLSFSDKKEESRQTDDDSHHSLIFNSKVIQSIRNMRKISKTPYKVLDAPGLLDDFYQVRFFFLWFDLRFCEKSKFA